MLTKGAIGNLINRYRAVLKKCNLINTFGSLAVASMLVMGGAGVASAERISATLEGDLTAYPAVADDYLVSGNATITITNAGSSLFVAEDATGKKITITGNASDGVADSLTVDFTGPGAQIPFSAYNGVIEISGLSSLNLTGKNVDADVVNNNAFYTTPDSVAGNKQLTVNVGELNVGTADQAAEFIVFAPQGGIMDIDADTINVNTTNRGLWAQASSKEDTVFTMDADTITMKTGSAAFGAVSYNKSPYNPDNSCTVVVTARDTITVDSTQQAATIMDKSDKYGTGHGTVNLTLTAKNDISLASSGDGIYSVNVKRVADPDNADNLPVRSKLTIDSTDGNVSVDAHALAVRLHSAKSTGEVSAEISAAKKVTLKAISLDAEGYAVQAENADLTVTAGEGLEITAANRGFNLKGDSNLTVNGDTTITAKGQSMAFGIYMDEWQDNSPTATFNGTLDITSTADTGGRAYGIYAKAGSVGTFKGDVTITANGATGENSHTYGIYGKGTSNLTFDGKTSITINSNTTQGFPQGVRLEYNSMTFNKGLDITVNDTTSEKSDTRAYGIDSLGDATAEGKNRSSILIKGTSSIKTLTDAKSAYGINVSSGVATILDGNSLSVEADSKSGNATAINVQYFGDVVTAKNNNTTLEANGKQATGLAMSYFSTGAGSATFNGNLDITATGVDYAQAITLANGSTLTLAGDTVIAATATGTDAEAHALTSTVKGKDSAGNIIDIPAEFDLPTITNSGSLTVESGKLSGFTGTYTQTAGSTDIKDATDFFGGIVNINAGSLTVDAAKLDADYAADVKGANFKADTTLNVDFAGLNPEVKEYSSEQYNAAKGALFDGKDAGKLVFVNATLKVEEDAKPVLGGKVIGDAVTITKTPVIVTEGMTSDEAGADNAIGGDTTTVVQIVDSTDDTHKLLTPENITLGAEFDVKAMQVGEVTEDTVVSVTIADGADVTFAGGTNADEASVIVDKDGKAVAINTEIADGATLTVGNAANKEKQLADFNEVKVEGKHNVHGNDASNTKVSYKSLTHGEKSEIKFLNAAVHVAEFTGKGGKMVIDPAYVGFESIAGGALNSDVIAGSGSVLNIGAMDIAVLKEAASDAGLTVDNATDSSFTVGAGTAVVALGSQLDLGTGSLVADGSQTASSSAYAGTGNATFAANSLFVIDSALAESAPALTGAGTLSVDENAKLYLVDAQAGKNYTIADFASYKQTSENASPVENKTWDKVITNSLTDAELVKDNDGNLVLKVETADMSETLPGVLPVAALTELSAIGADSAATVVGKKFLSLAIDPEVVAAGQQVDAINEVSHAAVTAGVQNTSLRIADAASNTVLGHMSLASNTASVHADGADFWAAPMYGNLYTSGMVTSGSSVRGQFGGLALGVDVEAGKFLGGQFRVGTAINGGGGQSETKGNVTSTQNDYDFGGLNVYAAWNKGALNVMGSVGYGFGNHEVEMGLPASMGMGSAKADIDTSAFTADLRAEYQFKTDCMDIMPHAGIRYTSLQTNAHDLNVGGAVLNSVASDTQNIVQFPIGVTLSKDFTFADWTVKPMADVSVIPAVGEKKATTKVNFSGLDAWDSVNTRIMDSTSWAGTVGVQAEKGKFTFGLNYGVQASSNETDQNVQVKLGWKF